MILVRKTDAQKKKVKIVKENDLSVNNYLLKFDQRSSPKTDTKEIEFQEENEKRFIYYP